ncbi:MAG: carboxypeptidase regulatory-like domain-containing protein [Clostridiales Family XIII bacterium]|nr:carboxypeptidase regulatory-like domain-containing protein [Clostridiales Family XIII bacterium]
MSKVFVVDVTKCNGCYSCQMACKDEHCGNDWFPVARPQPDTGQFWCKLKDETVGTVPKVRVRYTPTLCNHCERPACQAACDAGAIYAREDGLIIIDPETCNGCGKCAESCLYGSIYLNGELGIAQKCTGCAHLLDNGYALPRCVEICPTGCLQFGEESALADEIAGARRLQADEGLKPRVWYRNLPGQFIAGTVYDPASEEVIIGARCRAVSGGKLLEVFTDNYGDFWFNDLPVGKWEVFIEPKGYKQKAFYDLNTRECINLGDIAMEGE